MSDDPRSLTRWNGSGSRGMRIGAVIAVAVAVAIGAWLLTRGSSSPTTATTTQTTATTTVSVTAIGPIAETALTLGQYAQTIHQPIYWAGPKQGYTYELTRTSAGNVYVRYLPPGVKVGDTRSSFLFVVTYPFPDALTGLKDVANGGGTTLPDGGLALPSAGYAKSYHLAYPNVPYEIEVYDPSPARAKAVALSGQVRPVG